MIIKRRLSRAGSLAPWRTHKVGKMACLCRTVPEKKGGFHDKWCGKVGKMAYLCRGQTAQDDGQAGSVGPPP